MEQAIQIKLEVFDSASNQVIPGTGTFNFIVPKGLDSDGETALTREINLPEELDSGGFVFNLEIDNNNTEAIIDASSIGGTTVADYCGFLLYDPTTSTPVTIAFHATHPNKHATCSFNVVRGSMTVHNATTINGGEVSALTLPTLTGLFYTGDGNGNFNHSFERIQLLKMDGEICTKGGLR